MRNVSGDVGLEPTFAAVEISMWCIGQRIAGNGISFEDSTSRCGKSRCDSRENECTRNERQSHGEGEAML